MNLLDLIRFSLILLEYRTKLSSHSKIELRRFDVLIRKINSLGSSIWFIAHVYDIYTADALVHSIFSFKLTKISYFYSFSTCWLFYYANLKNTKICNYEVPEKKTIVETWTIAWISIVKRKFMPTTSKPKISKGGLLLWMCIGSY